MGQLKCGGDEVESVKRSVGIVSGKSCRGNLWDRVFIAGVYISRGS